MRSIWSALSPSRFDPTLAQQTPGFKPQRCPTRSDQRLPGTPTEFAPGWEFETPARKRGELEVCLPISSVGQRSEPLHRLFLNAPACSGPEGFVLGLVTGAATVAIVYGLSCGADLVQNWALFSAGVATLIR